jgi:hypothetical protein
MTVSHFIMPGSADTAEGAAIFTGITKEATINIAAKTPSMLGNLVFIIPPDFFKPGKSFRDPLRTPWDIHPGNPRQKLSTSLHGSFYEDNFLWW